MSLVAGRAVGVSFRDLSQITPGQLVAVTLAQDLTLGVLLVGWLRWWPRLRPRDLGLLAPVAARAALLAGAGLWLASAVIGAAEGALVGAHPQALIVAVAAHRDPGAILLDIASGAAIVAPAEELLFRAVLFGLLRQRLPFAVAAAASSGLFALTHEIAAWPPIFAVGLGLAYLYERYRSLWTNAIAHGTFNAISFVLLFLLPDLAS